MQLTMNIATKEQLKHAWAFAAYQPGARLQRAKQLNQAVITSVSKEARNLGIATGMEASEARLLLPGLRILLYGGGKP